MPASPSRGEGSIRDRKEFRVPNKSVHVPGDVFAGWTWKDVQLMEVLVRDAAWRLRVEKGPTAKRDAGVLEKLEAGLKRLRPYVPKAE